MKKRRTVDDLLNFDLPEDELLRFHEKTKIKKGKRTNSDKYPRKWKNLFYKGYSRFKEYILPKPQISRRISFVDVIKNRDSSRDYKDFNISLSAISNLCYFSFGLKDLTDPSRGRFYASAGARYPIEIYLLSLNSKLPTGIYHYYFKNHSLENIFSIKKFPYRQYLIPKEFKRASCFIIMTGIFERSRVKYGLRAYPFIMMEAGHIGQNIYLVSAGLNLDCCAIGGFNHYKVDKLLDVDGIKESSIYMFAVGYFCASFNSLGC